MMTKHFVVENFLITRTRESRYIPTKIGCRWRYAQDGPYFGALDLRLRIFSEDQDGAYEDATGTPLDKLVHGIWDHGPRFDRAATSEMAITIILVPRDRDGFVCRSDLLHLRLGQSQFVEHEITFAEWNKHLLAVPTGIDATKHLLSLIPCSPGALLLKQPYDEALQEDLVARLSFNWLLPNKPASRRVAVVSGRPFPDQKRQMYNSQGFFAAARALGISLVVVDDAGHWLEDSAYQHLRDDFVPVDMDSDHVADLPARLFAALRDKHLDGIVTFWDGFVTQTAEAAELLGLPTESASGLRQAHFKHEMRKLVTQPNIQAVTFDSVERLEDPSMAKTLRTLQYPMVLKPCRGRLSESVKKVTDEHSMREAVRMAFKDEVGHPDVALVLLETYVEGPELDANFMLWDGKIQFLEVTDSFPCAADATGATLVDPFRETVQISNTRLPPHEIEIIRSTLHQAILKLGFRSGVFHIEARMKNSSMKYQDTYGDGIIDLHADPSVPVDSRGSADVFLVEVNVRPPGPGGTWATLFAYGVDQGALHFLRALEDGERFAALSQPYAFPSGSAGDGGGAQYWTAQCLVPIHRENIRVPDDLWERVYKTLPEVEPFVIRAEMYATPGTVVTIKKSVGWIGYVLLYSRTSRRHVLEMYHRLAATCIAVLDEELQ